MQVQIIKKIKKKKTNKKMRKKKIKIHKRLKHNKNKLLILMKKNGKMNGYKKIQKLKYQKNQRYNQMMI